MILQLEQRHCRGPGCPVAFKVLTTSPLFYCSVCAARLGIGMAPRYGRSGKQGAWARKDDPMRARKTQR